ncbi:MAG: hypothetical protein CVV41_22925 [Candidatus Riflebacteria bacterium HGW-Riflebacteria-1]|jgi:hypothetical protein|nr:MAG: hypothetical protein CVV41_22925 [Candidatus Riflebacteria bacterium HGW-Riflebacteria-1]
MNSYLLLIKGSFAEWNRLSETRRNEITAQFADYAEELAKNGRLQGGDGCGERSFRFVNAASGAAESLLPLDTRDMVTGYFLFEVETEEEAIEIAKKCPAFACGEYVELVPCGH